MVQYACKISHIPTNVNWNWVKITDVLCMVHVGSSLVPVLEVTESWAGHGNEAMLVASYLCSYVFMITPHLKKYK